MHRGTLVLEVVGLNPGGGRQSFHFTLVTEIIRLNDGNISVLTCSENTRDNGRNKEPKCFVQLPLVTGSQRHMAEKIKETENSALSLRMCGRCQI